MPIVNSIKVNDDEIALCRFLAQRRYEKNRLAGVENYVNTTSEPEIEKETRAILGEWAFAKMLGIYPPTSQDPSLGSSPDFTFELKGINDFGVSKITVEIKTARNIQYNLQVSVSSAAHPRDIYVLMIEERPFIHFMGWTDYTKVASSDPITEYTTPYYEVPQSRLKPDLRTLIKIRNLSFA